MDDETEDLRVDELGSIEAIFPEIQRLDDNDPYTFILDLPVNPVKPVVVTFPSTETPPPPTPNLAGPGRGNSTPPREVDSHELSYLPSISLGLSLPSGYPSQCPPKATVTTSPPWLTTDVIKRLEGDATRLWENIGRDMVAYTYIDHIQQGAEDVFDMVDANGALEVDSTHKLAILDYDIKSRRTAFEKETFVCGVCLDPKKGSVCHKMTDCGHVFCVECLGDFYNNAIKEGDLAMVRCLGPSCAKDRAAAQTIDTDRKCRKPKTHISPSELLQIGLSQQMVTRYVNLKYKNELELDKDTVYCPRSWCNGAAQSKKHKKPKGLEYDDDEDLLSDNEGDDTTPRSPTIEERLKVPTVADLLAICADCGFAFCSHCSQSWHGEFVGCHLKRDDAQLSAEEAASLRYLEVHTSPCPTCAAPSQKSHGCNHMICFRCCTHFCYLCSSWLDPSNPYAHFNTRTPNSCYHRLWELEEGDGDDVGIGFAGGAGGGGGAGRQRPVGDVGPAAVPRQGEARGRPGELEVIRLVPEIEEPDDDSSGDEGSSDDEGGGAFGNAGVAREGPLVLRIGGVGRRRGRRQQQQPVPPAVPPAPPAQQQPGGRGGRRNGPPPRMRGQGRQGRGGRGRGRGRGGRGGARAAGRDVAGGAHHMLVPQAEHDAEELDPAQQAWVRQFVLMALNDEEDSDSDDEVIFFN